MSDEELEYFIVVRVKYERDHRTGMSPHGYIRQAIHDVAEERDIKVSDFVLPSDRTHDYLGRSVRGDFLVVKSMYDRTWKDIASILARRPKSPALTPEQEQRRDKNRSLRQARDSIIRISRHLDKYGFDGLSRLVPLKKGRHAK